MGLKRNNPGCLCCPTGLTCSPVNIPLTDLTVSWHYNQGGTPTGTTSIAMAYGATAPQWRSACVANPAKQAAGALAGDYLKFFLGCCKTTSEGTASAKLYIVGFNAVGASGALTNCNAYTPAVASNCAPFQSGTGITGAIYWGLFAFHLASSTSSPFSITYTYEKNGNGSGVTDTFLVTL